MSALETAAPKGAAALDVRVVVERPDGFRLDVAFQVPRGITVLFGPSGAGKSTALAAIAGLVTPSSGTVRLGDEVWFDAERRIDRKIEARKVAYVFQSLALFPHKTALDNVVYGAAPATTSAGKRERARALLEKVHVAHLEGRKPSTFSGGEAQRVALARALAIEPRIVLFDEAFSALDPALRRDLVADVGVFLRELEVPALVVTHDAAEARALGDRAIRLERGKVVASGSVDDLVDP
jgi:molybdate transport system ATP-binding protein